MNLEELKERVDFLMQTVRDPREINVYITLDESSVSDRAKEEVQNIYIGFDWEHNQCRIEPEHNLIRKT